MKKPKDVPLKTFILQRLAERHSLPLATVERVIDWQFKRINEALVSDCRSVEISGFCRLEMQQRAIATVMSMINKQAKYFLSISPTHPRLPRLIEDFNLLDAKIDDHVREQYFFPGERHCGRMEERPPKKAGSGSHLGEEAPNLPPMREELPEQPSDPTAG